MAAALIGTPVNRVDGRKKVTGAAQYAAEIVLGEMAHGVLVGSAKPSGCMRGINTEKAERAPGVLLVLTHLNADRLGKLPNDMMQGGTVAESRPPLADNLIHHTGQYVAMVVAEQLEQARYAASLIEVDYEADEFAVVMEDALRSKFTPEQFMGEPLNFARGDVQGALDSAPHRVSATYITPTEHPCALEPHATVASWSGDVLTVHNSTQWVMGDRTVLSAAFGVPPENVRILCPFTGGMFGSKGATGSHTLLAASAARRLQRPVKVVLNRTQVLVDVGHRSETVQRMDVGAKADGTITALRHHVTTHTALFDDFPEPATISSRMLYAVENYQSAQEMVRLNVVKPSWMRAPGEAPGQFALESLLDELSYELGIDPVELRRRNHATINPHNGKPFSSKHLLACYEQGAERFGWAARNPRPGSTKEGDTAIGWGMATATYPGYIMGAVVKVRLEPSDGGVRAVVSTAGADVGTGMYTMLAITAADGLGLPIERVSVELGSSEYTQCAVAGGSNLTASTSPAANDACTEIKKELLKLAAGAADGFTGAQDIAEFVFRDGRISHRGSPSGSIGYSDLLSLANRPFLEATGETKPIFGQNDKFAFQSFGAHFVEVRVQEAIGRIRVSRIVSVFNCGRILSAKTARSQFLGGIVFGIGAGLMEELSFDRAHGQPVNADLAGYLVPVHADVPEIDVTWIDEPDLNFNSMGCRGVGEIGITGVAAAIANAVYHATGVRVRDLPLTPDKLLRRA